MKELKPQEKWLSHDNTDDKTERLEPEPVICQPPSLLSLQRVWGLKGNPEWLQLVRIRGAMSDKTKGATSMKPLDAKPDYLNWKRQHSRSPSSLLLIHMEMDNHSASCPVHNLPLPLTLPSPFRDLCPKSPMPLVAGTSSLERASCQALFLLLRDLSRLEPVEKLAQVCPPR